MQARPEPLASRRRGSVAGADRVPAASVVEAGARVRIDAGAEVGIESGAEAGIEAHAHTVRPGRTAVAAATTGFSADVDTVDALLPQTQCRRCGYDACRPYAEALVRGDAGIGRCPPGGDFTVASLARVLGRPVVALDPACGVAGPREAARIDESACIGCTVCIRACPVDAIIGARKWMHTVLESECTGCGLCVEPCPVDCIAMVPARVGPVSAEGWLSQRAPLARRRFKRRGVRESTLDAAPHRRERAGCIDAAESLRKRTVEQRRMDIAAAVARVRSRRARPAARDEGRGP